MKIVAILSLIVIIMAGTIACAPGSTSPQGTLSAPTGDQTPAESTSSTSKTVSAVSTSLPPSDRTGLPETGPSTRKDIYSVQIDLSPSKLVFLPEEQIQMELALINNSKGKAGPVIIQQIPPTLRLIKAASLTTQAKSVPPGVALSKPEYEPVIVKTFPAGTEKKTLAVGEKVASQLTWDQKNENGNLVSPGWYYYESYSSFNIESSEELSKDRPASIRDIAFLIQHPQGAMTKTIDLNQAMTVTGLPFMINNMTKQIDIDVVITLKRVELSDTGVTFYVTMTSPNNPVSGYNNPDWRGLVIQLNARYVVDGVVKEARAPSSTLLDSGIELRWGASVDDPDYLDPAPADARELTLAITDYRPGWEGPWEFKIKLN